MPEAVTHPTAEELAAFGLGKLPDHAIAAIAAHLENCPDCRHAVAAVPADSFLDRVRAAAPAGSSFPPNLAQPSRADRPALPSVSLPDIPPELARHPKYLILRELNRGGMGVVYQARHKEMGRQIVIKVIRRSLLDQPGAKDRFRREIRAAAQLSHPNIVTAYDAEQAGDLHILVMEFVPGQSLAEVLEKKGPLPVDKACHYVSQAAVGLHHAYKRNMVHRDIKPSNLMLTPQGQVKILDFGLAKIISESSTRTGLTASDTYMGTPEYSAPEQATDARSADIRADIYSLGCTLYFLLAGRPPFREDTAMKTVLAHMQQPPQPLTELRPDVPERLWRVVARMLVKDPVRRYQKPKEVVLALAPFIKPGSKRSSAPAPDAGSPNKGTVIETESEIEKGVRVAPRPTRTKEASARIEAPSSANWTDETEVPNGFERFDDEAMPPQPSWWKRPGVLAIAFVASLALILITIIMFAANEKNPNGVKGKAMRPFEVADVPDQREPQKKKEDAEAPPPQPERKPRKLEQEEEQPKKRADPEPAKVVEKREEQPAAPQHPPPPAAAPKVENKEPPANPVVPEPKKATDVDVAIDKGVIVLRMMQRPDGTWPPLKKVDKSIIGATALAGLTLLECGSAADDTAVQLAADVLRRASLKLTHTYSVALSILFLDRLGDPADIPFIESLTVRLLAGQSTTGGWSYDCPAISDTEVRRLTDTLAQRSEPAGPRKSSNPGVKKRTFKDLPKEIQQQVARIRVSGIETKIPGDNSNTQFAILGLWVGHRYGLPIENALKRVEIRFRNSQLSDGSWGYILPDPKVKATQLSSEPAMTCAGLFGLAMAYKYALEIRRERNPQDKTRPDPNKDASVKRGLFALSAVIGQPRAGKSKPGERGGVPQVGGKTFYFLWALERMAVALDRKTIGKKNWYEWGVELLLANQQADGSWKGDYAEGGVDTCFALLFLKRSNLTPDLTAILTGKGKDPD